MKHGNNKYNFDQLLQKDAKLKVKPANIYSLKSAMRVYFGKGANISKSFQFDELGGGHILITRL